MTELFVTVPFIFVVPVPVTVVVNVPPFKVNSELFVIPFFADTVFAFVIIFPELTILSFTEIVPVFVNVPVFSITDCVIVPAFTEVPESFNEPSPLISEPELFVNALIVAVVVFVIVPLLFASVEIVKVSFTVKSPLFDKVF